MGRKKLKLLERLRSKPKDFKWSELTRLLSQFGYKQLERSGSRVKFYRETPRDIINIHKPHPGEILKGYQIKEIIKKLEGVTDGND